MKIKIIAAVLVSCGLISINLSAAAATATTSAPVKAESLQSPQATDRTNDEDVLTLSPFEVSARDDQPAKAAKAKLTPEQEARLMGDEPATPKA